VLVEAARTDGAAAEHRGRSRPGGGTAGVVGHAVLSDGALRPVALGSVARGVAGVRVAGSENSGLAVRQRAADIIGRGWRTIHYREQEKASSPGALMLTTHLSQVWKNMH